MKKLLMFFFLTLLVFGVAGGANALPVSLYESTIDGLWSVEFILGEGTGGKDKIWIKKGLLSGNYELVPEPDLGGNYELVPEPDLGGNYELVPEPDLGYNCGPVPEPATMLLLGTGLVGLVGFRKKLKK